LGKEKRRKKRGELPPEEAFCPLWTRAGEEGGKKARGASPLFPEKKEKKSRADWGFGPRWGKKGGIWGAARQEGGKDAAKVKRSIVAFEQDGATCYWRKRGRSPQASTRRAQKKEDFPVPCDGKEKTVQSQFTDVSWERGREKKQKKRLWMK